MRQKRKVYTMNQFSTFLVAGCLSTLLTVQAQAQANGTLTVEPSIVLRNSKGSFRCALFTSGDGFPKQHEKAVMSTSPAIVAGRAVCRFSDVPVGAYAVAVLHDENNNMKMDNAQTGMPIEGFGASNDVEPGPMSPPSFTDAVFKFDGKALQMTVLVRYMDGT
jgi:uncharacterized protein (DUF2141 family)